jgi:hypothetical protein
MQMARKENCSTPRGSYLNSLMKSLVLGAVHFQNHAFLAVQVFIDEPYNSSSCGKLNAHADANLLQRVKQVVSFCLLSLPLVPSKGSGQCVQI